MGVYPTPFSPATVCTRFPSVQPDRKWGWAFDFGLIYLGEPEVDLSGTSPIPAAQPLLDAAIAIEEQEIADDIEDEWYYRFFPVLTIGFSYHF